MSMIRPNLLFLTLSCAFILSSCVVIKFTEPQPKNGKKLETFPKELIGLWQGDDDSIKESLETNLLKVENNQFIFIKGTKKEFHPLSDSLQFYAKRNLYVLNILEDENWLIYIIDVISNNEFHAYPLDNVAILLNDKNLESTELKDGDKILDPNSEDFETSAIAYALFTGQMNYRTLKKCIANNESKSVFRRIPE